jgi:hypothetical protein
MHPTSSTHTQVKDEPHFRASRTSHPKIVSHTVLTSHHLNPGTMLLHTRRCSVLLPSPPRMTPSRGCWSPGPHLQFRHRLISSSLACRCHFLGCGGHSSAAAAAAAAGPLATGRCLAAQLAPSVTSSCCWFCPSQCTGLIEHALDAHSSLQLRLAVQ